MPEGPDAAPSPPPAPAQGPEARRSLKVRLPRRLLVKLQAARVLQDRSISETVEEALRRYFDDLPRQARAAPVPPPGPAEGAPPP